MQKINQENLNPNKIQSKLNEEDQSHLTLIRTRFEKEIQKRGDESIEIWLNYIEWSDQLYIDKQITKKEIIDLYNRALTNCKRNKAYQNDPRLLKIFINYITKYESKKLDWLSWMNHHKYCVKLAQFYIEYAKVLETVDRQKAFTLLRNSLKANLMEPDQSELVKEYLNQYKSRIDEQNIKNSENQDELSIDQYSKVKFAFSYLMLKPNLTSEFQFEEIRARKYVAIFEATRRNEEKFLKEIEELKKKLDEIETREPKGNKFEISNNNSRFNKNRDTTMNRTNRQSLLGTTYNTTAFNNTNFTDVTHFNNSDDMILSDDDGEPDFNKTRDKSLMPQIQHSLEAPTENFSITNVDSEVTLANIRNTMMNTFADATLTSKSITARTSEARRMAEKMFNQTDNTALFEKSEMDTNTMPSISIYKDPTILSETQTLNSSKRDHTLMLQNDENVKIDSKQKFQNQDGSMFFYETDKLENKDRKPLCIIADTQSQPINSFNLTENEPTTSITKFIEFEPPAASTRSIKPLLKKMNQFNDQNLIESMIDTTFDKDVNQLQEQKNQEEKEKLLNDHLDLNKTDSDKNLSKILDQDFNTQTIKWSNCTQKTQKQVKFNLIVNNSCTTKVPNVTNVNNSGIQWDYNFMEVDSISKKQKLDESSKVFNMTNENQTLASLTIPNITLSAPVLSQPEAEIDENSEPEIENEKGVLTQKNLEKTFNDDYYKLFYNQSIFNNTSLNVSKVIIDKIIDDEEESENLVENGDEKEKTMIDEYETNMITTTKTTTFGTTTLPDFSNNSVSISSSETSITAPNLNETLMSAIREPFNIDIKNKLLDKGPLEMLKKNENFASLKSTAPIIREKIFISLKDNVDYKIIKEIGKGSFAKIYLIEQKGSKKKMALKVDRQATSWEFYITESLHERLKKMLDDKTMKVNVMDSFIRMNQFIKYQNGCFSAMNYYNNGSLLDLINFHINNEAKYPTFPYWFVLYLTLEMLYILQYLHESNIIHADIKPDNLIINLLPDSVSYFDPSRTKCLVLIDFNRSIDLNLLGGSVEFEAKIDNKSLLIPEMKEERPWSFQVDFYGILCSIHCVIFKKYMKTYKEKDRNRFVGSFPRGYDKMFDNLFDTYLNVPSCTQFPDIETNFIENFKRLFLGELAQSFMKSKQYLTALKEHFQNR